MRRPRTKSYHLNLNLFDEQEKAVWNLLAKAPNKKNLIIRAVLYYAQEQPRKVSGPGARAAERASRAAAQNTISNEVVLEQMAENNETVLKALLERIDVMEERVLDQFARGAVVVTAGSAADGADTAEEEPEVDTSIVRRIERAAAPTEEQLDREAMELDPLAQQFLNSFM